jgi:hypothetical protein
MEINYIIVISFCCCNDSGVVGDGKCTFSTLCLLEHSHVLLRYIGFPPQREFGLVQCATPIQVLTFG